MALRSGIFILIYLKVSIMSCIFSPYFPKWESALRRSRNGTLGSYGTIGVGVEDEDVLVFTCLPLF